jgi:hypothetical protein
MIQEKKYTEVYTDTAIDDDSKTDIIINGEKLIAPKGFTIKTATTNGDSLIVEYMKNKPQYPKTYEECCDILQTYCSMPSRPGYKEYQIALFQELLICRDAYWKIAVDWKPNFGESCFIYAIGISYGTIQKMMVTGGHGILLFPTEEMRDAFLENFKDLIEKCKELL